MSGISRKKLLKIIDAARIREAIEKAEKMTSGEIRVTVSRYFWGNVHRVAKRAFLRLGMTSTRQRNAILFFVVPSRRRFAVIGDQGIHEKVGDIFWQKMVEIVSDHFQTGDFTAGLVAGIEEAGRQLAAFFPFDPATDVNELPDDLSFQ